MPDPPDVGLFTRYVLENPYPVSILLLAVAAILGWRGLREGVGQRLKVAGALLLLGVGVLLTGLLVVTAGEHGEAVSRDLVDRVVIEDLTGAVDLLADDATLSVGSPGNPGIDLDAIITRLDRFAGRATILSNRITTIEGYGLARDRAEVHLACLTDAGQGWTPSRWVLIVEREDDGQWLVRRIVCISISNRTPPSDMRW